MEGLIEVLKRWNPWEAKVASGIQRGKYLQKIMPFMERKEVLVLKGIRRSGKSTLMKQLMEELLNQGVDKKQILYLNLEDYNLANDLSLKLFEQVLNAYRQYTQNKKKVYFFIDEIQKISFWEKWIRTKYDLGEEIKFIISGSSASLLSRELSTLLTGRNLSFTIFPLSFKEFLLFSPGGRVEEYFHYGGFPEVVLEKSEEKKTFILQQYFEDIVHKDIINRYAVRNPKQILELARYLVSASGSKVSINKLSKTFGLAKDTLQAYINYMLDAYLLFEVTFFSYSAKVRHDVAKLPKLYCLDNGFINAIQLKYSKNTGQIFENSVFLKLIEQNTEISYWGEGESEVDFIVGKIAINVTSSDNLPVRERKGLTDFDAKHRGFVLLLISKSLKQGSVIPLEEFLKKESF